MSANARIDTIFQENKELITLKNPSAQAHECLLNELTGINMGWSSQKRLEVIINLGYLSKDLAPSDFDSLWNNLKDFWSPAGSASHFSHTNHHHQRKKFTREHMDVFNAGDTSSGKNIPGPPGNRTPIPLLSPLARHPAPPVFRSNIHGDPNDSPLFTPKRNSKRLRHEHRSKNWTNEMDEGELFGQTSNNGTPTPDHRSGTPHPTSQPMGTLTSLRTLLFSSISEAKVTTQNTLMLTKTPSITEPLIIDEVSDLLNIITGKPTPPYQGTQSDKQILETLAKLTEKVDKLSKQVNEPKKVTSNHREPTEGLEASKHAPHLLTKSYAQAANNAPKNLSMSNGPPTPKPPT